MLIKKEHGNHIRIYSDEKKKIRQKKTGFIFSEAIEDVNCHYQNEYEEVE